MAPLPSLSSKCLLEPHRRTHRFLPTQLPEPSPSTRSFQPPLHHLEGLPVEIKQLIFSFLPDIPSLAALISTCSSLYYSFLDRESYILAQILPSQIPSSLIASALATFKSSATIPGTKESTDSLATLYTSSETPASLPRLTLRSALAFSRMHDHVQFFANSFTSSALSHHPVTGAPVTDGMPVSSSELDRIQATLYRFEYFCNLFAFRRKCSGSGTEISAFNLRKFEPWENEQLACICDYLVQAVSEPIDDVAHNRSLQPARKGLLGKDWRGLAPDYCLPLGLAFLHRLVLAKTHKERSLLLNTQSLNYETFFDTPCRRDALFTDAPLPHLSETEQLKLIPGPCTLNDDDDGPSDVWYWAHHDHCPTRWYNTRERHELRKWGYVMWDYDRLDKWGVFNVDWRSLLSEHDA